MQRTPILFLVCVLSMGVWAQGAFAATRAPASFNGGKSLVAASSSPGNSYAAGASVVLTAPVAGDFTAVGGSVITASPVAGDDLLFGGSVSSRSSVAGDLRAIGGSINVAEPVGGDFIAMGLSVEDSDRISGSTFIIALNTIVSGGADGPVTIYGNNVALGGDFRADVTIVAGGHVGLAPDTRIHGKLSYQSPDVASIPPTATIDGGVDYTNASYLPDIGTSRLLAYLSIGFFLVARIIGTLILAGLLAGLFPSFAQTVTERFEHMRLRETLLLVLLGFGVCVATPIVIGLLMLTFIGIGLAILLLILYALLFLLAFIYAGIVAGNMLARRFRHRKHVLWHDGVVGMAIVSLVLLIPFVGIGLVFLLTLFSAGLVLQMFFRFAFSHDAQPQA